MAVQLLGHLAEAAAPGGTWDSQVTIVALQQFQALGPDLCKQFVGVQLEAFCEDLPGDPRGIPGIGCGFGLFLSCDMGLSENRVPLNPMVYHYFLSQWS